MISRELRRRALDLRCETDGVPGLCFSDSLSRLFQVLRRRGRQPQHLLLRNDDCRGDSLVPGLVALSRRGRSEQSARRVCTGA